MPGGRRKKGGGREINNLIHYLLCKAHQHRYTMATIELLIAFLSYPPGEKKKEGGKKKKPMLRYVLSACQHNQEQEKDKSGEGGGRQRSVECLPPRSNYNAAI